MSDADRTTIEINVDTFNDQEGFFVRTELEMRSVTIHGPFADLKAAQGLKATQLARRDDVAKALSEDVRRAAATLSKSR